MPSPPLKTRPSLLQHVAGALLAALSAASVDADTYRWVDDEGIVNFAERAPRDIPPERVTRLQDHSAPSRTEASASSETSQPTLDSAANPPPLSDRQQTLLNDLQAAEQVRQSQIADIRAENCARAQRVLANLTARTRLRVRNADGTERAMGEDERQQKISAARQGIVANCNS